MPGELESRHAIQCDVYVVLDHCSEQLIAHPAAFMNEQRDKQKADCPSLASLPTMHFLYYNSLTGHSHSRPEIFLLHSVGEQLEQLHFFSGQGDSRGRQDVLIGELTRYRWIVVMNRLR